MEIWTNLGIEKTRNVDAINEAYHKKLPLVNPEDKPEEFKALRSEYEAALKYAAEEEKAAKSEAEKTPVELWIDRVDAIYKRIADRCDAEKWKEILSNPIFDSLEFRAEALDALMVYLMEHWHLPNEIWQLLDEKFDLRGIKDELVEKYPADFINNAVMDSIDGRSYFPYELFLPQNTGDVDPFFSLYFKARNETLAGDADNAKATLEDLAATGIVHPFADVLRLRHTYMSSEGDAAPDEVLEGAKALYEKYPGYSEISGFYADMLSTRDDNASAVEIYDKILEAEPENNNMRYHKAQSLMALGDYNNAKELLQKLNDAIPYNVTIRNALNEANKKLIEQYSRRLEEAPKDFENRMEYAWCLFQNDDAQKAREVMDVPAPEELPQLCDYENIISKLCQAQDDNEECLRHAQIWREAVGKLPEGETEEEKHRKNKLGDIALVESAALLNMKRYGEALQKADESLSYDPDEYRAIHLRYAAYMGLHQYDEALKTSETMVEMKPSVGSYYLLGKTQYIKGLMQEAFNSFGDALEYDKNVVSYFYRARILIMYDEYDDAQQIIDMLRENEIYNEDVKYCESLILHYRDDKDDEASELWRQIVDADEKGECDCELLHEVYSYLSDYMINHDADPNEILAMIERGLKSRDDYSPLLLSKGYVLDEKLNKHTEGLEVYRKVYEMYPRHNSVCEKIGSIYYFDLHDIPTALSFYKQQEERSDYTFCQVMLGNCYSALEQFNESEKHFKAALELDGESIRAYGDYAKMLMRSGRYEDALAAAGKREELSGDKSPYPGAVIAQILARMGRYAESAAQSLKIYEKFGRGYDLESAVEMYLMAGDTDTFFSLLKKYKEKLGDTYYTQLKDYYMWQGNDRKWLSAVKSVSSDNSNRLRHLANYYYLHGDDKKALNFIGQYYAKDPDSIMERYIPITCLKRLGITEGLDSAFEEGLKVMSSDKDPYYLPLYLTKKANLYTAMGMFDEAKRCIDEAFAHPPCDFCHHAGCIDGYMVLALYYEAIGDYNAAAEACLEGQKIAPLDCDMAVILRRLRKEHKKELCKDLQK